MHLQYNRRHENKRHLSIKRQWRRWLLVGVLLCVSLFLLANGVMWLMYRERVLPNVALGRVEVGGIAFSELDSKVKVNQLLPGKIQLTKGETKQEVEPEALGMRVNWPVTQARLKQQRSLLPLLHLVAHRTVPVELAIDEPKFEASLAELAPHFEKSAMPERIVFNGTTFAIAAPENGYRLDHEKFKVQLLTILQQGKATLDVPTKNVASDLPQGALGSELGKLQKLLGVKLTYQVAGQARQPSAADIGAWFVPSGQTMVLSPEKMRAYVQGLMANLYNASNAMAAANYALDKSQNVTFVLASAQTPVKYTYCTAGKGVDQSHLPGFIVKVAAVLGDPRGWNAGGKIAFERVESGCDFTVWLSVASQMTTFGGACDNYYSCRSGRNVVINFDRWQGATDPWNASGGSLEDYRVMVTNHEVGHWLGFGHLNCSGPGQPAPVMQQQSISLQGCNFNPWPTAGELTTLKQNKGVAALQPREEYFAQVSCGCAHCTDA